MGALFQQRSLPRGQTCWGKYAWRVPSGNTINDIHSHPKVKELGVKGGYQSIFMQDLPNHGLELNISHIVNLLEDQGGRCLSGTLGRVYEIQNTQGTAPLDLLVKETTPLTPSPQLLQSSGECMPSKACIGHFLFR